MVGSAFKWSASSCGLFFSSTQQELSLSWTRKVLVVRHSSSSSFWIQFGPNSTPFLVAAEVYPALIRATAHGISAAIGKLGPLIATVLYNYIGSRTKFWVVSSLGLLEFCLRSSSSRKQQAWTFESRSTIGTMPVKAENLTTMESRFIQDICHYTSALC